MRLLHRPRGGPVGPRMGSKGRNEPFVICTNCTGKKGARPLRWIWQSKIERNSRIQCNACRKYWVDSAHEQKFVLNIPRGIQKQGQAAQKNQAKQAAAKAAQDQRRKALEELLQAVEDDPDMDVEKQAKIAAEKIREAKQQEQAQKYDELVENKAHRIFSDADFARMVRHKESREKRSIELDDARCKALQEWQKAEDAFQEVYADLEETRERLEAHRRLKNERDEQELIDRMAQAEEGSKEPDISTGVDLTSEDTGILEDSGVMEELERLAQEAKQKQRDFLRRKKAEMLQQKADERREAMAVDEEANKRKSAERTEDSKKQKTAKDKDEDNDSVVEELLGEGEGEPKDPKETHDGPKAATGCSSIDELDKKVKAGGTAPKQNPKGPKAGSLQHPPPPAAKSYSDAATGPASSKDGAKPPAPKKEGPPPKKATPA